MISAFLHCVGNLWVFLKFLFSLSLSWRKFQAVPSSTTNIGPDKGDPLPQPTPQDLGLPTLDDSTYELDTTQHSFDNTQWESRMHGTDSFAGGKPSMKDHNSIAERGGIFFPAALASVDHLDMLNPHNDEDTSQDLVAIIDTQGYDTSTHYSSALEHINSLSTDMTDLEGDNVLNDSLVHDILSGLDSEADLSTGYDADTSDDFLECTTLAWVDIDGIGSLDSSWKHEVATAMQAFRSCKVDNDDILALLPEGKQGLSLHTRRISQGKQLQEIQDWRSDFRNKCEVSSESELLSDSDFTVITTFRFP